MKRCTRCGVEKPLDAFGRDRLFADGLRPSCKECKRRADNARRVPRPRRTLAARLWAKVDKAGPVHPVLGTACWLWTGNADAYGYGVLRQTDGRTKLKTHRVAYELAHGSIPPGQGVLHKCDVRRCVNPAHLFLGANADNVADMIAKGRQSHGETHSAALRRALPRGDAHPYRRNPDLIRRGESHPGARLTEVAVRAIRTAGASGGAIPSLAAQYGVSRRCIRDVLNRRRWSHVAA